MSAKVSPWIGLLGLDGWRYHFAKAISWNAIGSVVNAGCNIGLAIALARILGQEQFGKWSIVQNTMITVAGVAQLSIGQAATKFVAQFRARDPAHTVQIIRLCRLATVTMAGLASIVMVAGGNVIASRWLGNADLGAPVRLCAIAVFFMIITGLQMGILTGLGRFREQAFVLVGTSCLGLVSVAGAARVGGLNDAVVVLGVVAAILCFFSERLIGRVIDCNLLCLSSIQSIDVRMVASFAIPAALGGMISMPAQWFAYTCLVRQPSGFAEMGLFSAGNTFRALVLFAPLLSNRVSNSFLNHELAQPGSGNFRRMFAMNVKLTVAMIAVGAIGVAVAGPWALTLFGRTFAAGTPILLVLLLAGFFEATMVSYYQAIQSRGLMWLSLWSVVLPRDILIALGAWLLTPRLGALGLAIAFASGHAVALFVTAGLARKLNR